MPINYRENLTTRQSIRLLPTVRCMRQLGHAAPIYVSAATEQLLHQVKQSFRCLLIALSGHLHNAYVGGFMAEK